MNRLSLLLVASPALLALPACKSNQTAEADPYSGFGSAEFPYDAAGNYVGGGQDSAASAPSMPADSTPTPNYGDSSGMIASTDTSVSTDYSTPTLPGAESGLVTAADTSSSPVGTPDPEPEPEPSRPARSSRSSSSRSSSSSTDYNRYTVRRGDTLSGIASRYGTSASAIRRANGMSGNTIITGRTINVPGTPPSGGSRQASRGSGRSSASHRVQRGDTLYSIARRYDTSVTAIRNANNLSGNTIVTGTTLRIPR